MWLIILIFYEGLQPTSGLQQLAAGASYGKPPIVRKYVAGYRPIRLATRSLLLVNGFISSKAWAWALANAKAGFISMTYAPGLILPAAKRRYVNSGGVIFSPQPRSGDTSKGAGGAAALRLILP